MSQLTIEEALQRVRSGNVEDYRTIVVAFHQRLRLGIAALCPPGVDADEIAHMAFVHAYRRMEEYRPGTNFYAWLNAIARNLLRAESTRLKRRVINEQNYLEHLLIQRLEGAAEEETSAAERMLRLLSECLAELKTEAQALLQWRYRDRLQVEAIAERLHRSASAISVQLFGLRKLLRECVSRKQAQAVEGP